MSSGVIFVRRYQPGLWLVGDTTHGWERLPAASDKAADALEAAARIFGPRLVALMGNLPSDGVA